MEKERNPLPATADKLSRYICISAYVCLYPALIIFLEICLKVDLHPIFTLYSCVIATLFWFLSLLFIPAIFWFIITKIFKRINPHITIIYFILFAFIQLIDFYLISLFLNTVYNESVQ